MSKAKEHLSEFVVQFSNRDEQPPIEMLPHPLLTFGDATRNNEAGTLWLWGKSGRPIAAMELYRNIGENQSWVHALTLTSPDLVELQAPNGSRWTPRTSSFSLRDVPNPPAVGSKPAARLRQMKQISRRFQAHQFWDPNNSRFELRLLVQPVHRYQDEGANVSDGAIFVLANGTNPEVLLQIESHVGSAPGWKYSLVRLGSAEMHVLLDDEEVWTAPRTPNVAGEPIDPYWLFWMKRPEPTAK